MTTYTCEQAAAGYPVYQPHAGTIAEVCGYYTFAAGSTGPVATDVIKFCKLPANAIVYDILLRSGDVDTNGTETFDMDIGTSADTDQFLNSGVIIGDAVSGYLQVEGMRVPGGGLLLTAGPQSVGTSSVTVQGLCIASPATFNTAGAVIQLFVKYGMPIEHANP